MAGGEGSPAISRAGYESAYLVGQPSPIELQMPPYLETGTVGRQQHEPQVGAVQGGDYPQPEVGKLPESFFMVQNETAEEDHHEKGAVGKLHQVGELDRGPPL